MDRETLRKLLLRLRADIGATPERFEQVAHEIIEQWGVDDGHAARQKLRELVDSTPSRHRETLLMSLGLANSSMLRLEERRRAFLKRKRKIATSESDLYRKESAATEALLEAIWQSIEDSNEEPSMSLSRPDDGSLLVSPAANSPQPSELAAFEGDGMEERATYWVMNPRIMEVHQGEDETIVHLTLHVGTEILGSFSTPLSVGRWVVTFNGRKLVINWEGSPNWFVELGQEAITLELGVSCSTTGPSEPSFFIALAPDGTPATLSEQGVQLQRDQTVLLFHIPIEHGKARLPKLPRQALDVASEVLFMARTI